MTSAGTPFQVSTPMINVSAMKAKKATRRSRRAPLSVAAEVAVRPAETTLKAAAACAPSRRLFSAQTIPAAPERRRSERSHVQASATTFKPSAARPVKWISKSLDMDAISLAMAPPHDRRKSAGTTIVFRVASRAVRDVAAADVAVTDTLPWAPSRDWHRIGHRIGAPHRDRRIVTGTALAGTALAPHRDCHRVGTASGACTVSEAPDTEPAIGLCGCRPHARATHSLQQPSALGRTWHRPRLAPPAPLPKGVRSSLDPRQEPRSLQVRYGLAVYKLLCRAP
jgi:hypothetical protein